MKRILLMFMVLAVILINTNIIVECRNVQASPPPLDLTDQVPFLTKELSIDFYLDETVSMKGFVSLKDYTYYSKTLQILEDTAITRCSEGQVSFAKFSSKIVSLREREILKAALPGFYNGIETHIERVIKKASKANLTIIITDLFQTEADTALLIKEMSDNFIRPGLAVGILGIRSQYSGQVFDIDSSNLNFFYSSGLNVSNRFRPFYVLLLGKHSDIANFYDLLSQNGLNKFPETQFIIFSPYIVNPLPSFTGAKFEAMRKMVEVGGLIDSSMKDNRVRQFRLKAETGSFRVGLAPKSLAYTLRYDGKQMDTNIIAGKFSQGTTTPIDEAGNFIEVGNFTTLKQKLVFDTSFHSLVDKGVYVFDITVYPKLSAYKNPDWFTDWDMKTERIEGWRSNPAKFEGNTTLNLKRFLTGLWQANWQIHKPKVAHIFCYVENR